MAGQYNLELSGKEIKRRLNSAVLCDKDQGLEEEQKAQARENIGAIAKDEVVRYDVDQKLEESQKERARLNIGIDLNEIGQGGSGEGTPNAVRYDQAQELTELQKLQARSNIGAASLDVINNSMEEYFEIVPINGVDCLVLKAEYRGTGGKAGQNYVIKEKETKVVNITNYQKRLLFQFV